MSSKFKKVDLNQGKKIKVKTETIDIENFQHPVFCFKYLNKEYHSNNCTADEKKCLLDQLVILSNSTWNDLQLTSRKGQGSEKIKINSIKTKISIPDFITEDVTSLLAFRFDGNKPFVGYRNRFIFHVLFIDRDFTLYNH